MKVEVSSPGKIFLSGEYLALDGSIATILSSKQRVKVKIEESELSSNVLYSLPANQSFAFHVNDSFQIQWIHDNPNELGSFIEEAVILMQIKPSKTKFTIDTTDFYYDSRKIGIGSSSAISSALIKAINEYFNFAYTKEMMMDSALKLHSRKQNNLGSGLDVIAAFIDSGLIECVLDNNGEKVWKKLEWPSDLIIKGVITGEQGNTTKMIERYLKGHINNKEFFLRLKTDADQCLENLSLSWEAKDCESILGLMQKYNIFMQQLDEMYHLGIYTNEHRILANLANKLEIFYKPSGAGGGDLGFLLTKNIEKLKKFNAKLTDSNFKLIDLR